MAIELSRGSTNVSTLARRTLVRAPNPRTALFGRAAKAVWPAKTAAEVAARCGVTVRAAEHWLAGTRQPSARAAAALISAIFG